jgi:simple sugar transport system permease protein
LAAAPLLAGCSSILAALVVTHRMIRSSRGCHQPFALGLTSYVSSQVLPNTGILNNAPVFRAIKIPILGDICVGADA